VGYLGLLKTVAPMMMPAASTAAERSQGFMCPGIVAPSASIP
jgi:hypothetical protein